MRITQSSNTSKDLLHAYGELLNTTRQFQLDSVFSSILNKIGNQEKCVLKGSKPIGPFITLCRYLCSSSSSRKVQLQKSEDKRTAMLYILCSNIMSILILCMNAGLNHFY